MTRFMALLRDTTGVSAIEYGLLAALIAVAAFPAVGMVGRATSSGFGDLGSAMQSASDSDRGSDGASEGGAEG